MNKEIEEIVNILEKAENICYPLTHCRECKYKDIKGHCCFYMYSEKIVKAGYRQINEVREETIKEFAEKLIKENEK